MQFKFLPSSPETVTITLSNKTSATTQFAPLKQATTASYVGGRALYFPYLLPPVDFDELPQVLSQGGVQAVPVGAAGQPPPQSVPLPLHVQLEQEIHHGRDDLFLVGGETKLGRAGVDQGGSIQTKKKQKNKKKKLS